MTFFSKKKHPQKNKTFFQNYADHVRLMEEEGREKINTVTNFQNLGEAVNYLTNDALSRLKIFDSLRDGHDYFDEVIGATALPLAGGLASLGLVTLGVLDLANKYLGSQTSQQESKALTYFMLATAAFVLSVACFIKSAISLLSRPLATGINGFQEQDVNRFKVE